MNTQRLSLVVPPDLKRRLRKEAKRAGMSLSSWVRTRLELEGTDPNEVHALLDEIAKLGEQINRSNAEFHQRAESEAREREIRARKLVEARRQGRVFAERMLATGRSPATHRGSST